MKIQREFKRGITDLLSTHPWVGGAQGDESYSDKIEDNHDWMVTNFGNKFDYTNQEIIDQEIKRRVEYNNGYIQSLKEKGKYGEIYYDTITIDIKGDPYFFEKEIDKTHE